MGNRPIPQLGSGSDFPSGENVDLLKLEIRRLQRQLEDVRRDAIEDLRVEQDKTRAVLRAMGVLQGALEPIRRGVLAIYQEFDKAGVGSAETTSNGQPDAWDVRKAKVGGKAAEVIQVLLDCGPLTRGGLRDVTKSGWSTIDAATQRLNGLGWIEKIGGKWQLKN